MASSADENDHNNLPQNQYNMISLDDSKHVQSRFFLLVASSICFRSNSARCLSLVAMKQSWLRLTVGTQRLWPGTLWSYQWSFKASALRPWLLAEELVHWF